MLRRRAAAPADEVDEAVVGEAAQQHARHVRGLVVLAEGVRQARVRVAGDIGGGNAGEVLEEGAHLLCAERAVDPDDQRVCMLDGRPERLDGLPGEVPTAAVDRRERQPSGHVRRHVEGGGDRGLGVERVEDRLDQEEIDPAGDEGADLLGVGLDDLIEGGRPERRVVHLRRDREGHVERANRPGDEPRTAGVGCRRLVAGLSREPRPRERHLGRGCLEAVVRLADRRGRERVGGRDVRPGREVGTVDVEHDVGLRQVEEVGVALDVACVAREPLAAVLGLREATPMQQHAPRAVQDGDALVHDLS